MPSGTKPKGATSCPLQVVADDGIRGDRDPDCAAGEAALMTQAPATTPRLLEERTRPRSFPCSRERPLAPHPSSHRADDWQPSPKIHYKIT